MLYLYRNSLYLTYLCMIALTLTARQPSAIPKLFFARNPDFDIGDTRGGACGYLDSFLSLSLLITE